GKGGQREGKSDGGRGQEPEPSAAGSGGSGESPPPCRGQRPEWDGNDRQRKDINDYDHCPTASPPSSQQVMVRTLVERASARMRIPDPVVVTAPPSDKTMLVHMPTWFWLGKSQWRDRSITARAGDNWATATTSAYRLKIDPGDGSDPVTCPA